MKKSAYLFSIIVISSSPVFSQQTNTNAASGFIGITGGYARTGGNLIQNDYSNPASGYANPSGINLGIDGAYYFHKNIGIGGMFSGTGFNCKGLQTLSDGYKEDFDVDSSTVYAKGRYSTLNFLVGPYFSFPVNKLTIDFRAMGGMVLARTPQFQVDLEDQKDVTFYQNSSSAATFGFQLGAGLRYSVYKNLAIKLSGDFFYSRPDFKITNENRMVNAGRLIMEYKQPISGWYLNFGIAYQFKK